MNNLYNFLTGPALWFSFAVFLVGLLVRLVFLFGLSRERDRVFYNHIDWRWAFRSIWHWLIPWGSASMRLQPFFSLVFFVFHVGLLAVPLFLSAHNMLWDEAFGLSLWSMPDVIADILTVLVILCAIFLFVRRLARAEVRILSGIWDYCIILISAAPFVTGFLAYHQLLDYDLMMVLHVITGELLLILIPFTKLGHMMLFFFTRSFIGFEMGTRRGARSW
ncbi:MAG: nitrate reductase [Deltaproteobacteria bacterium CG_4_8_14_3_um_filter_51_11]|nr:nitrate reductase [bacterium]OIP39022.1 MAG: hypothetical protein AUK25_11470 [Desulfobacteraceae bacterium CG2_30_51_40]PIV99802.1 MAG: nitrate reductase [Deltaproteobacteria bacterium CG17_big_fil_post_rev_8_21_14_2_50_51_6]PIX20672.1 MAG: nitrate reductase [Deltaproteobacteria bacterium CG_4_8_14_3_um_filter_51_11]PJB34426.1 MAG: nitrate reductase [Deltaproteobacteria bacterium CG_4_9_14_3_um_filter_51_14]